MGCVSSKPREEDNVVSLCKDRKRLLKSAVEGRHALAEAHCKYYQSLYSVAAAIRLFVARHSSPSSPFLITFDAAQDRTFDPMLLQQRPSQSTHEAIASESTDFAVSKDSLKVKNENNREEEGEEGEGRATEEVCECEHFYGAFAGWDYFNPFYGVQAEGIDGFSQGSDEDLSLIREEEGIPELEEDGERNEGGKREVVMGNMDDANVSQGEQVGLGMDDGRELLEALKDVEDHFVKAYDSGLDVSRMLEASKVHGQSGTEEIKVTSNKLFESITWDPSTSSQFSSGKSFLASSSKSSSTLTIFKNDLFDDFGGMESGSHSLTLGRLYAWEKKLYEEVKAGDETRKIYERKCSKLRNQDARGNWTYKVDKTRAEVRDLYTRILVAVRSAESISKRIQKLRDEELQPQIFELLYGLMRSWKIMLESHEAQNQTMFEVKFFTSPAYGKFCNNSHRLATFQLEAELQNWRACFDAYVKAQKAYIEALRRWLSKFIAPEVEFFSGGRSSLPPCQQIRGPKLLVVCHEWLSSLDKLPDKAVSHAMKSFGKDIRALWVQQGKEQQQKRKVDGLTKELDQRFLAFQKEERRVLESKPCKQVSDIYVRYRVEWLMERKNVLEMFRQKLEAEKEEHHRSMQETQRITVNGFQTGFSAVFESLVEFSQASLKMCSDLVTFSENAKVGDENSSNPFYVNGMGS
ncbi:protein ALTERED PHOSPHATE STARVATION RESPONSE 1-like [Malania oleifera]|uniref:protein ALTERED PHOSPHATE STARVATION RESPONSE 1-like n=1 Tax=Malania oleifera TaxID=397392 RepID=UPI0025AE8B17|nr:protein ALTERED PHOSPHATE STARVATION RESPONSE 1-like [Malania oleifera]